MPIPTPIPIPAPPTLPVSLTLRDGRQVLLREIREQDKAGMLTAFRQLSADARYTRFMASMRDVPDAMLERAVHPDPRCEFALVATTTEGEEQPIVGGARYAATPGSDNCEFAVTVMDDWTSHGLARGMMEVLIGVASAHGYRRMEGYVLASNTSMRGLARRLGFDDRACADDATLHIVERELHGGDAAGDGNASDADGGDCQA